MTQNNDNNHMNTMLAQASIRGASRMIAQGTEPKDVTQQQIQQVAADVELFIRQTKVSRKSVAESVGWGHSVITEFLKGNYRGDSAQVAIDLDDWLIEEEKRRANQNETVFTWTNVARYIDTVARYCLDYKKVGMIYGPQTSGLGKTRSMREIARQLTPRRSTLITLDKCDANPTGLLRKILNGLRLNESGSSSQRMTRIVDELKGRSHLLMIDQVHNLRFAKDDKPLYYLMDIYEATGSAQLWAGTSDLVAYLTRQQTKTTDEPLAQIRRRIFPCVDLMEVFNQVGGGEPLYTVEQIREMFSSFKLKLTPAAARWLCSLAHQSDSGALGLCVQIMEYATNIAKIRGLSAVDVPLLKEAMNCGLTSARATRMITRIEQPEAVQEIKAIA